MLDPETQRKLDADELRIYYIPIPMGPWPPDSQLNGKSPTMLALPGEKLDVADLVIAIGDDKGRVTLHEHADSLVLEACSSAAPVRDRFLAWFCDGDRNGIGPNIPNGVNIRFLTPVYEHTRRV